MTVTADSAEGKLLMTACFSGLPLGMRETLVFSLSPESDGQKC